MDDKDWLAQQFEEQRPHLRAVAYRMVGSLSGRVLNGPVIGVAA